MAVDVPQKGYPYLRDCQELIHNAYTLIHVSAYLYICITSPMNNDAPMSSTTSETMRFTDHASSVTNRSANPLESTFMLADTSDRVEGFFSRPQRIATYEWTPGLAFHEELNPWTLYFSNDKVRERLSNFAWLRCTMHVRILINATKFYYGRMIASYTPMHLNDNLTFFRPGIQEDFMEASQRPCVIMDPTSDDVGELTFPFMYPKSALSIPAKEWDRMGLLTLADLTVLRNSNAATDSITVTVFAWAENVDYSQPTSLIYENEGGEEEYYDGPISKPAHKVARFMNRLGDVPYIGLYARATEMVASAGAAVAKLFGYSRPTICDSEHLYTPYFGKRLATINVEDTCDPLSLDVKKEVPIDPRITGAPPDDHMAFVPLAKRECYLTTFDWDGNAPTDEFLFNLQVHPIQRSFETARAVHTTPAAWVASLFRYWRGSMRIRFEVVASAFHRGRLRILYDPLYQTTAEYNVNYTHTIDLCSENDYTMEIGWAQNLPYIKCDHLNSGNESHSTTAFDKRTGNGVVSVFVVNSLTSPGEQIQPVRVNVYVSMCDDFEVQDPYGIGLRDVTIPEQNRIPPSIVPGDPPDGLVENPLLQPIGQLNFNSFANDNGGPGGSFVLSIPPIADYPQGSIVIGGTTTDQSWQNPTGITIFGLRGNPVDVRIDLQTLDAPGSTLPDFDISGVLLPWSEGPAGVYTTTFLEPVAPTGSGTVLLSTSWAGTTPVAVTNSQASRINASGQRFAGDITFNSPSAGITLDSDAFGDHYVIPTGNSISILNPAESIRDLQVRGTTVPLDFDINGDTYSVRSTDFPARIASTGTVNISDSVITITNPVQGQTIRLYGYTWSSPAIPNEGAIINESLIPVGDDSRLSEMYYFIRDMYFWLNECEIYTYEQFLACLHTFLNAQCPETFPNEGGTEEEVQPERMVISENAAGTVGNLPELSHVFFGEVPSSFRQVVKRYTLIRYLAVLEDERRRFTIYANPRNTSRGQVQPSDVSLWSWCMKPYLGWKGSTRHKFVSENPVVGVATISRLSTGSFQETEEIMTTTQQSNIAWEGSTTSFMGRQIGEAVIPWYSNFRFRNCRIGNPDTTYEEAPAFNLELSSQENRPLIVRQLAAGGEDYSLYFWVSTPIVDINVE